MDEKRASFWRSVAAEVAALPVEMKADTAPRYSDDRVAVSALRFRGIDDVEVLCLARPRGESVGVLVQFPAYATVLFPPVGYAEQGLLAVSVSVRGHQGSEIPGVGFPGLLVEGLPRAETYVYRGVYADALRAVALVERLIAPGLPLVLMGQSQGAALSIFAAALTHHPLAVAADVPFLCSIRESLKLTSAFPYRELSAYLRDRPEDAEEALDTIDLFDVPALPPMSPVRFF